MRWLLVFGLLAVAVSSSPMVAAQSIGDPGVHIPEPMVADRPTDSASPVVVPPQTFQVEAGYKVSRTDDDSGSTDVQVLPDLLARYGISTKVELRLVAAGWTVQRGASGDASGFSDISLGTKIELAERSGMRPDMGLLVEVSLPVGQSDFTSGYVIPRVLFLGASSFSDRHGLTYNLGPSFVTEQGNGETETHVDLNYAVALSGSIGGGVSLFGEFYGAFVSGSDRLDRHSFQAGTTILLSPRFQIDIRGGIGLVNNEPDWLVGAGLAFRVPR